MAAMSNESISNATMMPIIFNSQHSDLPIESGWVLISSGPVIVSYDCSITQGQLINIFTTLRAGEEGGEGNK